MVFIVLRVTPWILKSIFYMFKFYKHKIIVHKKEYEHFHIRLTQTSFAAKNIPVS